MAEIILPPEENEETPQVPELNIDKPTENSKVITIEFEAKKTNKVSTKDTNQQLYTTDTDAWFEFKETSLEGANGTYSVVFRNRHDGSIFQRTGDVVNGVAYYKIPHQEIRHAGAWRGQIVYTLSNGNTTAREFDYDVKGHILDGKDVREIVVEDFETLMSQLRSMKDNAEVELANLVNTANQNETDRQIFFDDLVDDIEQLQANYQELLDTGVLQTNINTKLEALEEEYAPKLTEVTAQLAQTQHEKVGAGVKARLEDLNEEVLTAIEGGEGTEFNLLSIPQDKSVTPPKTTFMKRTRNLFNGNYKNMSVAGSVGGNGTASIGNPDSRTAIAPIEVGKTYYIKIHETQQSNRFRVGTHTKELTIDDFHSNNTTLLSITELLFFNDALKDFTFTSNIDGFVYVTVSNDAREPLIQIENGETPTDYVHPYLIEEEFIPKRESEDDSKQDGELSTLSQSNKNRLDSKLHFPKLANVNMTITDPGARFIDYFDNKMWGYTFGNGDISYSEDGGITWVVHTNKASSFSGAIARLLPTNDGEVLAMTGGGVYKSIGWNSGTVTWSTNKVTKNTNAVLFQFGIDGDGTKFILVEYASTTANWSDSRFVWISTDMGNTFSVVRDCLTEYGAELNALTHMHGACYDRWADRFYISEGHSPVGGLYYSEDDGATWGQGAGHRDGVLRSTGITPMEGDTNGPTVIIATPTGLVMGSDNARNGMFGLVRKANPLDEVVTRTYEANYSRAGLIMFAIRGWLDEISGTVYVSFRSEFNDVPPIICAGTPTEASVVYEYPTLPVVGASDHFGAIAKISEDEIVAYAQFNGNPYTLKADLSYPPSEIQNMIRTELRKLNLI